MEKSSMEKSEMAPVNACPDLFDQILHHKHELFALLRRKTLLLRKLKVRI
jgi:hypothetical protein